MVIVGDCRERLREMADGSVQTCITSPPYFGLRDYGVSGQIGLEASLDQYVAELVAVFREVRRVLHDTGTLWLNLGDSYAGGRIGRADDVSLNAWREDSGYKPNARSHAVKTTGTTRQRDLPPGYKPKDLLGVPWRVAFALQADGWYLRSDIVWHKPNPMPESVRDRPTKAHEYVFLLTKQPKYFYDAEAVAEPATNGERFHGDYGKPSVVEVAHKRRNGRGDADNTTATRNRRTVWTITPKPFKGAHFAVMPPALVEPCILAGTSERGQCPECGAPWRRVVEMSAPSKETTRGRQSWTAVTGQRDSAGGLPIRTATTTGWQPSCSCNAGEPVPQLVLDPFAGAGTVGVVALSHGRRFVGVELNPEYARMAEARIAREVRPRVLALPLTEALEGAAD